MRADLTKELEDKRQASLRPAVRQAPPRITVPPRPVSPVVKPAPASVALWPAHVPPPTATAPAPSPIVLAERVRAQAIIAMTPKGAEAEDDGSIRSGMSVAEFEGNPAAWSILDARRQAEGR